MQAIMGNTYPVRAELRMLGGIWDPAARAWIVPDEKADTARRLVMVAGYKGPSRGRRQSRPAARRGRCIDAPCCGCCD